MNAEQALEVIIAGLVLSVLGRVLAPILMVNVAPLGWLLVAAGVAFAIIGPVATFVNS